MNVRLSAIILAAGASSRMGRPKLLLPWGHDTVLSQLIAVWRTLATQVAVVHATGDETVCAELNRLGLSEANRIANPDRARGMFSSIQCAARWNGWEPTLTHFAIALGDQPHLQLTTLLPLMRLCEAHPTEVCQPNWNGRGKHPVVLPRAIFEELRSTPANNLKEFLRDRPRRLSESDDPWLDLDLDTPADYERAHQIVFGKPPP